MAEMVVNAPYVALVRVRQVNLRGARFIGIRQKAASVVEVRKQ
jgi:hypothetical protein